MLIYILKGKGKFLKEISRNVKHRESKGKEKKKAVFESASPRK